MAKQRKQAETGAAEALVVIDRMYDDAEDLRDYPGEYFPAKAKVDAARKQWTSDYPIAAMLQRHQSLLVLADDLERKAKGALVYDADGSLTPAMQDDRHDKLMAEAAAKRAEAQSLPEEE